MFTLLLFSTLQIAYLIVIKPFKKKRLQKVEVYNELTTLVLTYVLACFSIANPHEPSNYFDYAFLSFAGGNLIVHLIILMRGSYKGIRDKCRRYKLKKNRAKVPTDVEAKYLE